MKGRFLFVGLWLLGIVVGAMPVHAIDLTVGEVLRYKVFWGPLTVGTAELSYVPQGAGFGQKGGYVVQARVKSDTTLMTMDDLWRTVGQHGGRVFTPQRYEVVQAENQYTSNKLMQFKGKKVSYTNFKDKADVEPSLVWNGKTRDPLSTVYAWRHGGVAVLGVSETAAVVGLKRTMRLERNAAVQEVLQVRGRDVPVWKVDMLATSARVGKKPAKSGWTVWLDQTENLVPVQIVGRTAFGTFRAQLERR